MLEQTQSPCQEDVPLISNADTDSNTSDPVKANKDFKIISDGSPPISSQCCKTVNRVEERTPKYLPGCISRSDSHHDQSNGNEDDLKDVRSNQTDDDLSLSVLLKSKAAPSQGDINYIKGEIARRIVKERELSGQLPKIRCKRLKLSLRKITLRFHDKDSMMFYKSVISDFKPADQEGYTVSIENIKTPFKTYRSWIPEQMMDTVDDIPDFLSIETDDVLNKTTVKVLSISPSITGPGYIVYFDVDEHAHNYLSTVTSSVMCGAHSMRFNLVQDRGTRTQTPTSAQPLRRHSSDGCNWRQDSSSESSSTSESVTSLNAKSPTIFYSPTKNPFNSTTSEIIHRTDATTVNRK